MTPTRASGLLAAALIMLGSAAGDSSRPGGTGSPVTGTIAGTVTLEPAGAPRRSANRYAGGPAAAHADQPLAPVVYLKGRIAGSPPPGYVATPTMMQRDTAFAPSAVAVMVGGTVSFPNGDPFFHNVFSYSTAKRFDLGRYPEGETKQVTFDGPGIVQVFCEVHDFMRGAVVVTENPYFSIVAADGRFSMGGVPEGEHTLVIWHADHQPVERTVTVTNGGISRVEVELKR